MSARPYPDLTIGMSRLSLRVIEGPDKLSLIRIACLCGEQNPAYMRAGFIFLYCVLNSFYLYCAYEI